MPHRPDALCSSIISEPPVVLKPSDSILSALRSIIEHRVPSLPVVDADGRYLGMFPRSRLIALAMPHVLSEEHEKFSPRHMLEGGFIQEPIGELQARMDAVANDPVSKHLDTHVPVLGPKTLLTSAMFFFYRERNILPVVDNGKLLGLVTIWDVLARLGRIR